MEQKSFRQLFYEHEGRLIHKWDHYFEVYDKYFQKFRGQQLNILEIGISHGGSIQLWKKYFGDEVHIFAIDINPQCKNLEEPGSTIFIGSQSDTAFLKSVNNQLPALDIIIDDGGHTMEQQKISFEFLFLKLKEGGIYMVEDTHTSYAKEYGGGLGTSGSFIEYAKRLIDTLCISFHNKYIKENNFNLEETNITKHINSISFYDSIVVFEKKERKEPFDVKRGEESIGISF